MMYIADISNKFEDVSKPCLCQTTCNFYAVDVFAIGNFRYALLKSLGSKTLWVVCIPFIFAIGGIPEACHSLPFISSFLTIYPLHQLCYPINHPIQMLPTL